MDKKEELVKVHNQLMTMSAQGDGMILLADAILRLRTVIASFQDDESKEIQPDKREKGK
ncbi:MAG: hypothetical protein GX763_09180 [Clostridiaceae bacterium]|nr:hypothetical protein [Clostridiaceae bacterium]